MKADERKEIETNSLVHLGQRLRQKLTGRTLYYLIGTVALIVGAILLYRYLTGQKSQARDAALMQVMAADTPDKLKKGMEEHRGTVLGSMFKMQLARKLLLDDGLPKLGTDRAEDRKAAAASTEQARGYFLELTGEWKEKEDADLLQESWLGAAKAEEALVGMPTAEGGTDSRGNVDKAIEYYDKAGSIFPDTEFSKGYKAWADKLRARKDQFVADQKAIYKPREALPPLPTGKDPFGLPPIFPKGNTPGPTIDVPGLPPMPKAETPAPKTETPVTPAPKTETPAPKTTTTAPAPESKKGPEPKPAETPKAADPKAK
jgi:cell division septation protein DedD